MRVLITGSSGYFGPILYQFLDAKGVECIGIDINATTQIPVERQIICDLCDQGALAEKLSGMLFDAVIHLASQIDFAVKNQSDLFHNNVASTKNLIELSPKLEVKKFIFTSSNSVFLGNKNSPIGPDDTPIPIDPYGKSKIAAEKLLLQNTNLFQVNILRCPNIIDAGRVGMLSLLFELLMSNATLWLIGGGKIRHQCLYAQDLAEAILKLLEFNGSTTHNIGSENIPSFKELFNKLAIATGSKSRIRSLPSYFVVPTLKVLYRLKMSPLGPYQFRMLTQDFEFDLKKIKEDLNWSPTKNNFQILEIAYHHYLKNLQSIKNNKSANSAPVKMGLLSILKYIKF